MAALEAVERAAVDYNHLVFRRKSHGTAVNRDNLPLDPGGRGAWHVIDHFTRWLGNQPVTHAHFFLGHHDVNRGGHDLCHWLAVLAGCLACAFAAYQFGFAKKLGLITEDGACAWIFQRRGIAKNAKIERLAARIAQAFANAALRFAPCISAVAAAKQHAAFLGGNDARCLLKRRAVNNQWFG